MKKILYCCISLLTMALAVSSCSKDEDDVRTFANTPEKDMAGTYTGTFSRVQSGTTDPVTETGTGTITFTAGKAYVAEAALSCTDLSIDATVPLNVAHSEGGFAFSNNLSTNAIGAPIFGRIDESSNINASFQLKIKSGRSTKTYNITFTGKKDGTK